MRLYQSSTGKWFGTQADARRNSPRDWREVDVPTSKQDLLNWLNSNPRAAQTAPAKVEPKPELLAPQAASWVAWALETLNRGHKSEAIEMLRKGLQIQKGWTQ